MRIISGKNRGRKIVAPAFLPVRPTTDAAKESLFNILNNHFNFEDVLVLDLFSGTGNISYEFVSRGCPDITCVDNNKQCIQFIKETADALDYHEIKAIQTDFSLFLNNTVQMWDIIFADPPYDMDNVYTIPDKVFRKELLKKEGWLIIEHDKHIDFSGCETCFDQRRYGKVNFSFFRFGAKK